jgi:hypothetical protein
MKILIPVILLVVFAGCTSTQTLTEAQQKELMAWGSKKSFEIISYRAWPVSSMAFSTLVNSGLLGPGNTAGSIDITDNANYFRIKGDTISARLPYFGERYFGNNNINNEVGISFNNQPDIKKISWNEKKQRVELYFRIKQERNSEMYDILIYLFSNHSTKIDVTSSERTAISFLGTLKPLKVE